MGQKKLIRFEAIKSFPNVFQYPTDMAGNWKEVFQNNQPITLELACGKGEYTVALAKMYPERNFIGVDLKGNRLYIGAKQSIDQQIKNTAFLRTQIQKIEEYFSPSEVEEIWITFPDPQLRNSKAKKRLTHPVFLRLFQKVLKPGGLVHLKTDSPDLYAFTLLIADLYQLTIHTASEDIHSSDLMSPELSIKTHYEGLDIAQSRRIHYLCFSLPSAILPDKDELLRELINSHEETTGGRS